LHNLSRLGGIIALAHCQIGYLFGCSLYKLYRLYGLYGLFSAILIIKFSN
jgi:hypothetical protein